MTRAAALLLMLPAIGRGQGLDYVKSHYTKREYRIPMRDGVKLFTAVFAPKDDSRRYPILMTRTPYGLAPYGEDHFRATLGPSEKIARQGYILVYQDVRGRFQSEGEFVEMRPQAAAKDGVDESTDTYDTIEWLVSNVANHNGRVGTWGVSYLGFYAAMTMINAHPALKAVSPQAPMSDLFLGDDAAHNGAFYLAANFGFYDMFVPRGEPSPKRPEPLFETGSPDGYRFLLGVGPLSNTIERYYKNHNKYWNDLLAHTTYDEFWKKRNIAPHLKDVRPAVMTVGGWFDAEDLSGPLRVYRAVESQSPGAQNILVMGPWAHGGWARGDGERLGPVRFGDKTAQHYRDNIEFAFFERHLNQKGDTKLAKASMFETGSNRWRSFDAWPPAVRATPLYFVEGQLQRNPPAASSGFDEYVSDPAKPVPFIHWIATGMPREYMVGDQRQFSSRPDVLTYESEPLEDDLTIAGPISVSLLVSTTGTDADFVVKLIDVYPDDFPDNPGGYQQLLRGEPFRARFRNGFEKSEPMQPGKMEKIAYEMPDVLHCFRRGHRVMVQVQSTWFPLVDRNPQKFVADIPNARAADFQKATHRVCRGSRIVVGVLP